MCRCGVGPHYRSREGGGSFGWLGIGERESEVVAATEANNATNKLANMGCIQDVSLIFHELCPSTVGPILLDDMRGVSTPHCVIR